MTHTTRVGWGELCGTADLQIELQLLHLFYDAHPNEWLIYCMGIQ
jgi:hypothetical protein